MHKKVAILCDFDGTVAADDVGNLLFEKFSNDGGTDRVVGQWERGEISSRECLEREAEMTRANRDQLDRFIIERRLDPYFKDFHDFAKKRGMEVVIMSDGLDYYIESLLLRNGLGEIDVFANRLRIEGDILRIEFPHYDLLGCEDCACCKTHHLYRYREKGYFVVYVGDGLSDTCPSAAADMVFAKGSLLEFCQKTGIDHIKFRNFRDVEREVLQRLVLNAGSDEAVG
jgi:2-hydroxy-3-keto-5-methylthiopentenyl-1-phosphate phosphatase